MTTAARNTLSVADKFRPLFYPESVALVGASSNPAKIGYLSLQNILQWRFPGRIYPVNPEGGEILGLRVFPSIASIPGEKVDLALIARPGKELPSILEECRRKGARGAVIVTGGLKEMGTAEGQELEERMACAAGGDMKIIGPNTIGMINRSASLNVSFQDTLAMLKPGNISLVTQSGGTCMYMVHQLMNYGAGVSKAMSLGNRCNIDFPDLLEYLAEDDDTRVVILHVEGLDHAARFIEAGQKLSCRKPVLSYKVGNFTSLTKAVCSHTGALAGKPEFQAAALKQAGFIPLTSTSDLVDAARALSYQPPARGNRFAVLSPQAGPAIIISDTCQRLGLCPAEFTPATREKLHSLVDPTTYKDNPIDMAVTATRFDESVQTLATVAADDNVDIIICATLFHGTYIHLLRALIHLAGQITKPVVVCTDTPLGVPNPEAVELEQLKIPTYPLPERAALAAWALAKAIPRFED
ncbi:MAG: CoA-binding protein [Chloroflexi bacterium]|nr:CoA-binding protein [Chloroflexota bacterium]